MASVLALISTKLFERQAVIKSTSHAPQGAVAVACPGPLRYRRLGGHGETEVTELLERWAAGD
jgi:hypothetical protein